MSNLSTSSCRCKSRDAIQYMDAVLLSIRKNRTIFKNPVVLLSIFKKLDSREMVKAMRVCKTWFEVIDRSRSLWRRLILPPNENGWDKSVVELFDRKSGSTLTEVSMRIEGCLEKWSGSEYLVRMIIATLEKSKSTLRYLRILVVSDFADDSLEAHLSALVWKLPHLVDCITNLKRPIFRVRQSEVSKDCSSLRTLWVSQLEFSSTQSRLPILSNLVSLSVEETLDSDTWHLLLRNAAHTLKHVDMNIETEHPSFDPEFPVIELPNLETLAIDSKENRFPAWMHIPNSTTLIGLGVVGPLPSVSSIWAFSAQKVHKLQERCPLLTEYRFLSRFADNSYIELVYALRKRQVRVLGNFKVDGIEMRELERLVIYTENFTEYQLLELRGLVSEVVDQKSVEKFIEIEV